MNTWLEKAQAALFSAKSFVLPELVLHFYSNKKPVLLAPPQRIALEHVERQGELFSISCADKRFILAINPVEELISELENGAESALCVNIDSSEENFEESLLDGVLNKSWLYNVYAHKMLRHYMKAAEPLVIKNFGAKRQVSGCPRQIRVSWGIPYAVADDDCGACEYCIDNTEVSRLYCTGRSRVILPEDFNKPYEERTNMYPEMQKPLKTEQVQDGICPVCGGRLVERKGPSGKFLSCSHYPFCRFTANLNEQGRISFNIRHTQGERL